MQRTRVALAPAHEAEDVDERAKLQLKLAQEPQALLTKPASPVWGTLDQWMAWRLTHGAWELCWSCDTSAPC